jgi:hypothetical protein
MHAGDKCECSSRALLEQGSDPSPMSDRGLGRVGQLVRPCVIHPSRPVLTGSGHSIVCSRSRVCVCVCVCGCGCVCHVTTLGYAQLRLFHERNLCLIGASEAKQPECVRFQVCFTWPASALSLANSALAHVPRPLARRIDIVVVFYLKGGLMQIPYSLKMSMYRIHAAVVLRLDPATTTTTTTPPHRRQATTGHDSPACSATAN